MQSPHQNRDHNQSSDPSAPLTALKDDTPSNVAACASCRQDNKKCDGVKPACSFCIAKGLQECIYDVVPAEPPLVLSLSRANSDELRQEHDRLRSAFNIIQTAGEEDAHEIFLRLRSNTDIIAALREFSEGNASRSGPGQQ
ncbi:hypothetical protein MMC24_000613 [Lignoscripta atroalba]|nr:hypothetical protein [Lignoscripta atroalba]